MTPLKAEVLAAFSFCFLAIPARAGMYDWPLDDHPFQDIHLDVGVRIKNIDMNLPFSELSSVKAVPEIYVRAPKGRFAFELSVSKFSTSYEEGGQTQALALEFSPAKGAILVQEPTTYDLKETLTITPIVGSLQWDVFKKRGFRAYVGGGLGFYHVQFEENVAQADVPASYGASGTELVPAEHGEVGVAWTFLDRVSIVGNARRSFARSSQGWTVLRGWNQSDPQTAPIDDLGSLSYGVGITVRL